ncbi:hypothetical protein D9758_007711 [Tetrapyrgos nigripes]|uniref:DUF6924 domain-containing protein n=1 Tax=Tetrapyrgos nigripes TaxID=182062 RepID=A0A8H5G551_9AGAR|nr:hypothetical protein D9758_007711 [Tetrapyrgos nigripes]
MPERNIALYISSSSITPERRAQIQHALDTTSTEHGQGPARPGWIEFVPDSNTWSIGMSSQDVHQKHSQENVPHYPRRPIIILDERTAQDGTLLVVSPAVDEETDQWKHVELRFALRRVPDTAMNLVIGNQTLEEYKSHVDEDGVFRWFKGSTVPNPDHD